MNDSPPTSNASSFPTLGRLARKLFSKRTLGRVLIALALLATVIGLVCAEENWRGKRAWQKYKRELEAKGEKLDWKDYVQSPVPDDQNFAMTPFLAPLFDFNPLPLKQGQSRWRDTNGFARASFLPPNLSAISSEHFERSDPYRTSLKMTDLQAWALALTGKTNSAPGAAASEFSRPEAAAAVLHALEKFQPVIEELRSASRRPYARFNIDYNEASALAILLPHLSVLKYLNGMLQLRASAELTLNQTDQAWADTKLGLYLAETLKTEPFLFSKLVEVALVQRSLQPIWEGLAEHKWSDAQLAEIEQHLASIDLLEDVALRAERALDLWVIDQSRQQGRIDPQGSSSVAGPAAFLLGGFYYQNQLCVARLYQQYSVPAVDDRSQRVYPSRALGNETLTKVLGGGFGPYRLFARLLLPALSSIQSKFAFGQTRVNEAIVACALERYRLANGHFPESLEPLSPRYMQKMPHDIITGAPLIYRRTPDGQFLLYSVGWNEKDDGGLVIPVHRKTNRSERESRLKVELTDGDWVWQYPGLR